MTTRLHVIAARGNYANAICMFGEIVSFKQDTDKAHAYRIGVHVGNRRLGGEKPFPQMPTTVNTMSKSARYAR